MKYKSLKSRVLFWFGTVTFVILVLFSLTFNYFLNESINANIKNDLENISQQIPYKKTFRNVGVAIVKNHKILTKNKAFTLENIDGYLKKNKKFFIVNHPNDDDYIDALYIAKYKNRQILVFKKNIDNKIEDFQDPLLFLIPLLLIILVFLANTMINKILIPVQNLIKALQDNSVTKLSKPLPVPKDEDEIKELVISFNDMIHRLKEGIGQLDRFNSDVSHELKTPLTVIKGEVEVVLRKPREQYEYIQSLNTISYEADQIEHIVENLLLLTKYSKETIIETFEICHLDAIVLNAIEKYDAAIKNKHLILHIKKLEPMVLKSNPLLLYTIFSNLIDNAVKYTQNGKKINISLYKRGMIHFIIEDEGIGIAAEELSKITERFYRIDRSRNKTIKGFGLGLSLVKNSVALLEGEMSINSVLGKGTTVHLSFYV